MTIVGGLTIGDANAPEPPSGVVTWNPADMGPNMTLSDGNLIVRGMESLSGGTVRALLGKSTGKWVYEAKVSNAYSAFVGLATPTAPLSTFVSQVQSMAYNGGALIADPYAWSSQVVVCDPSPSLVDWIMFAVDIDLGKVWLIVNGQNINSGNPAGGTNPIISWDRNSTAGDGDYTTMFPAASASGNYTTSVEANFGATPFVNPIPAGFSAWQSSTPPTIPYIQPGVNQTVTYGEYIVVSNNSDTENDVYIYQGTTQLYKITKTIEETWYGFGDSLAINGNLVVIGAPNGTIEQQGAYIYDAVSGQQLYKLLWPGSDFNQLSGVTFGSSVGIYGNNVIVGAKRVDTPFGSMTGQAYIFNATTGALLYTLSNPNTDNSNEDLFGESVAIYGDYAAVGKGLNNQTVSVFGVTTGALVYNLTQPSSYPGWGFGSRLAIYNNYLVTSGGGVGVIHVFNITTGALLFNIETPTSGPFAIYNNYIMVGNITSGSNYAPDANRVYIYDITTGAPVLTHTINDPTDAEANLLFGSPVAIGSNYILVGATNPNWASPGRVYVYPISIL